MAGEGGVENPVFFITSGATVYARSTTSTAIYICPKEIHHINNVIVYEDRYKADGMMHDFRIDFMENRYAKVFLEDGKQVKCRKCKIQEVMSLDLRINTKRFMGIRESHWVWSEYNSSDSLVIVHCFNPKHGETSWGWEEMMTLNILCPPLPKDVIDEAEELISNYTDKNWNGHELYTLLCERGVTHVDFERIIFTEFSMRKSDETHRIATEHLYNKRMTKEHGPHWRTTMQEKWYLDMQQGYFGQ